MWVTPPVRKHLDPQVKVHGGADERLDFFTRRAPDRADTLPSGADENALLAISLDVKDCTNVHRRLRFTKLLDLAGDAVGHFVVQLLERGFANELAGEEADGLRADLVVGIQERTLRQECRRAG